MSFQFLRNETIYITKTNNIKDEIKDFFPSQKINLKNNITGVLNSKIPEILIKLDKKNEIKESTYKDFNIKSQYESENYVISQSYGEIKNLKYKSHYSLDYDIQKNLIIFNGTLNVTGYSKFNTEIDFINEILEVNFVDG